MGFHTPRLSANASADCSFLRLRSGAGVRVPRYGKIRTPSGGWARDAAFRAFQATGGRLRIFRRDRPGWLGLLTPLASFGIACPMASGRLMTPSCSATRSLASGRRSYELALLYFCAPVPSLLARTGPVSVDGVFGEKS